MYKHQQFLPVTYRVVFKTVVVLHFSFVKHIQHSKLYESQTK